MRKNLLENLKILRILLKVWNTNDALYLKLFIKDYYNVGDNFSDDFYKLLLNKINLKECLKLLEVIELKNIYKLISFLKYDNEDIKYLEEVISPIQYCDISKKCINKIVKLLKKINKSSNVVFDDALNKEDIWLLRRNPCCSDGEYVSIAYLMYLSIGFDNASELLEGKYGEVSYEKIYFLFSRLNVKNSLSEVQITSLYNFLFTNKKGSNNVARQMLNGSFIELFLNFDYFYNNLNYFIDKLGISLNKSKVRSLLNERYLTKDIINPNISGDVVDDMVSSFYCRYDTLNIKEEEILDKNFKLYNEYLKKKYKSSIPMIDNVCSGIYIGEVIKLSDPRNMVLGYRSGNCFRINGDASILFSNFLKSEHMRLVSISTLEYKDFAMMLVMRNGNVLIGQGIEVSKRVPLDVKGRGLYNICRDILKKMMDYMNANGDSIVATIIGSSNDNVSNYNNQILPFLVSPILENGNNYYNGIFNYQCLLDVCKGSGISDIKLNIPSIRYYDKREPVLRRVRNVYTSDNVYMEIEKRLISFRAMRFLEVSREESFSYYEKLLSHNEVYTCCNIDWYITLFDDGYIEGFVTGDDERAKAEYEEELSRIKEDMFKKKRIVKF